ncbi:hypothetical protein MHB48_06145 [Psychrobacillus sp. FSL H8-0483]|uniref:hypothetical protein n=1 Tax=Psychrobacillus sp. FSL H8-0483 TaxID=2921389 RepID=UPI00315AAEA9
MNKKFLRLKRQSLDYLLTDLLPYEKGNHYTHRYFYEYIISNKKTFNKILKNLKYQVPYFDPKWHSSPLSFKVSKRVGGFREISFVNPLGLIQSLFFIELFQDEILTAISNKKSFSIRKATYTNELYYKKNNKQIVTYNSQGSGKNQLLISLESSGSYFKHKPYKTITSYLNSNHFFKTKERYRFLMKLDIQNCFPSIYTHSYKWMITNKTYDSKNLKVTNTIHKNIDTYLQNINGSKTNGVIVGPEISRLLVDYL